MDTEEKLEIDYALLDSKLLDRMNISEGFKDDKHQLFQYFVVFMNWFLLHAHNHSGDAGDDLRFKKSLFGALLDDYLTVGDIIGLTNRLYDKKEEAKHLRVFTWTQEFDRMIENRERSDDEMLSFDLERFVSIADQQAS